jgi:PEP-CTERM motif
MRRFSAISAVVAGLLSATSAQALLVTIDDFNTPDMLVADQIAAGATTALSPGGVPNGRELSHELLSGINDLAGSGSKVTIGSQTFPVGQLEVANASGRDSQVKVSWTLASGLMPTTAIAPAWIAFTVTQSDGNPTSLELLVNGTSEGMFAIPGNTINDTKYFALSALAQNTLAGGGQLMLVLDGATGWDMTVDSVGIQVPEPTSVALVGLALVAAGAASRRKA